MSDDQIRALLVFPDLDNALKIRAMLSSSGSEPFVFYRATRAEEAITRVENDEYHVVITDLDLPDTNATEFISRLRKAAPQTPIVVAGNREGFEFGLASIQAGAQDYVAFCCAEPADVYRAVCFALARARQPVVETNPNYNSSANNNDSSGQMEAQDQFLSQFSHELRSPITAVYQFVTILLDGLAGELTTEQREYLEITLRNVNLMRDMVRDLMDVTRAQTGKLTIRPLCTSVVGMIAETMIGLQTAAHARGIHLSPVDLPFAPPILADPVRIQQVLNNLCDNALKFCTGGDTVTISASPFEPDPDYLCVSVGDTGCGISEEGRQQVFEYLYQDQTGLNYNRKGLGIGLAISRELVNRHGGHIWVDSEPGKGSVFSFVLPRYSLKEIISPLVNARGETAQSIQLVTIEVRAGAAAKGPISESLRQRMWEFVDRGTRTGNEMLLPRMSSRPERELFFMVVIDVEPISGKILWARLMRDAQIDESTVELRISTQGIYQWHSSDYSANQGSTPDVYVEIERVIENRTHERGIHNVSQDYDS